MTGWPRVREWLAAWWPAVVVVAAPILLCWRLVFTGRVLFWGLPLLQFYPWRWLALEQIRAGVPPLWNPYLGAGAPLLANYQAGVLYPPNWLGAVPGIPLDYSLGLVAVLHLSWAGLGMILFTRALGLRPLGQAVAGLAFSLSGYLVARLTFLTIIASAAWLPWLLWAVERFAQVGPRPADAPLGLVVRGSLRFWLAARASWLHRFLALSGLMALQLLAGHAQTTFYSLLLAGGWALWRGEGLSRRNPFSRMPPDSGETAAGKRVSRLAGAGRQALVFGAALAFAVALSAVQLLPTAELLRESPRAEAADYDFVVTYSFWPWRLLTLLAPDAFGNPAHGDYWGYGNYWEDAAYVGILPLGLALLALIARPGQTSEVLKTSEVLRGKPATQSEANLASMRSKSVPWLAGVAVVSLLLAMGQNTPLFPLFYRYVPGFDSFQAPARMAIGYVLAVSLLAGLGADAWARPKGRWRRWSGRGVAAGLGVALAAGAALVAVRSGGFEQGTKVLETMPRAFAPAGLLMAGAFLLSLLKPEQASRRWQAAVVALVCLDLGAAGYALNPAVDPELYRDATASGPALRAWLGGKRLYQFDQDEYQAKYGRFFRFDSYGPSQLDHWRAVREAQLPNLALLEGIASANNFDPLIPARYQALLDALQTAEPEQAWALLRALGVQAVVSAEPLDGMSQVYEGDGVAVYAVPRPAERIRIAYYLQVTRGPEQSLKHVTEPGFDPALLTVLEMSESDALYRGYSALCRSGLFDGLSRSYVMADFGRLTISGKTLCQYYTDSAIRSFNRSLSALADASQVAGFASPADAAEDVLGPFEALREAPVGQPVLLTETPTHIRIAAPMEFSGYLVLADTYYSGWRAYVDGVQAEIVPANHAFRAVFVPPGPHIVEFRYEPGSVLVGAILSGLAWLVFAALAASAKLAQKQPAAGPA